ncbi:SIMPL domain-containing protein [Mesobacterium pallidum]|uniref:SIMPL domain-containing protein n=1 Tax=Mesobacterium pallidum TaxID=2872037 RepID=UPI001EE197E0|nr:SIMPL domain-containing protein [Mesobacterium pallidum]
MRKSLFSLVLAASCAASGLMAQEAATITVSAEGEVEAAPDMAMVRIGVREAADSADAAMDAASAAMDAMLAALSAAGIEARDMQTSGLRLNPVYDSRSSGVERQVGFEAVNTLTLRIRDLDGLGGVLDTLVREAGANTLNGLSFGLSDPAPLMDEARRDAVAEARHRAEVLAEAAGVTLGKLVSIQDGGGGMPYPVAAPMMEARSAGAVPVAAGEVTVNANVTMTWEIGAAE